MTADNFQIVLFALSHLVVGVVTWYLTHRSQILALVASARELGPEFTEVFDAIRYRPRHD